MKAKRDTLAATIEKNKAEETSYPKDSILPLQGSAQPRVDLHLLIEFLQQNPDRITVPAKALGAGAVNETQADAKPGQIGRSGGVPTGSDADLVDCR